MLSKAQNPISKNTFASGNSSKSVVSCPFILLFFALFSIHISAQESPKRPKVGLVLSGGGAKGFAHIGVLKVLEEAGVTVDFIGGTSMGAVVGGLYASGYNAKQIDSIFQNTDFDKLLQDYIPRSSKSFYEKKNEELYAISLPFAKFKIGVPLALSKGLYNYNLLNRLTQPVRGISDFSKLPIPFVCIATDIETGKEVLLNKGNLSQCMLASSAFPSLFTPVEIDNHLLIDGGVTNNYPVEEVRKMGADIIIGVDVQDDLKDRKVLKEATRILVQISNIQMIEKMKQKKALTDIYIKPDIENYSVISFEDGQEIIRKGESATFGVYEKIKALAKDQQQFSRKPLRKCSDSLYIKGVGMNDLDNYTRAYVIGKLGFNSNSKITNQDLNDGINTIDATQNFSGISYKLTRVNDKEDDLNLLLTENNTKSFLKFSLHFDGLFKSAILTNLTYKKALFKNDVASLDVMLGDNFRYNFDYYIDNGYYISFGLKSKYNAFSRNILTDFNEGTTLLQLGINSININFSDFTNQAYIQTIIAEKFLFGLGFEYKHLRITSETLQRNSQKFENSGYTSSYAYLKFDTFDNNYFPTRGVSFSSDLQTYFASSNFTHQFNPFSILKGNFCFAKKIIKKTTAKFESEAGFSFGKESVSFFDFVLGGYGFTPINNFKPFYGYDFVSLSGNAYLKSALTFDYEFIKKNHFNLAVNVANIKDGLFQGVNWVSKPMYSGYALGYAIETPIGPVEIKHSWSPETNNQFTWFSVGFWF